MLLVLIRMRTDAQVLSSMTESEKVKDEDSHFSLKSTRRGQHGMKIYACDERFRDKFKNVRSIYNAAAIRILHFQEKIIFSRGFNVFNDETNSHRLDVEIITLSTYFIRVFSYLIIYLRMLNGIHQTICKRFTTTAR